MLIEVTAATSIIWLLAMGVYLRPVIIIIRARKGK
jgi:hypothetical protein